MLLKNLKEQELAWLLSSGLSEDTVGRFGLKA
jgi:hypothetical protein